MNTLKEHPFELMRRKSGDKYSDSIIKNFYIARCYGLSLLKEIAENEPFAPGCKKSLHIVFENTEDRMLFVARQIALSAHFLNFQEEGDDEPPQNRTTLTFLTSDQNIKTILSSEEYLCNLPHFCKVVDLDNRVENEDSYIDIEIHFTSSMPNFKSNEVGYLITQDSVDSYFNNVKNDDDNIFSIDTRKSYYTSEMYCIGETIDNLPYEDIHDTKRYSMALNVYQFGKLKNQPQPMFDKPIRDSEQYRLKEALSNVFCSDCFEIRAMAFSSLVDTNSKDVLTSWEKHNKELSESEHARWVVEKLIMGYRPLNTEERYHYQQLYICGQKNKLKDYRTKLKRNDDTLAHIDLCSYRDLRRVNPDNLKYDSFLMLGIPKILERIKDLQRATK